MENQISPFVFIFGSFVFLLIIFFAAAIFTKRRK